MARLKMPQLLVDACDGDEELLAWMGMLRESWQRWIAKTVMEPKSDEAKERRAAKWAELLLETKEAEQELPPLLVAKLRRFPDAKAGWDKMSFARRRYFLLAIFGAKSMEARENRMKWWIAACAAKGKRHEEK
jgi:uncharacterized protein YdeI (YjbR/CyaY-like superfamily)